MEVMENVPTKKSLKKLQVIKNITSFSMSAVDIALDLKSAGVFSDSIFNEIKTSRDKEESLLLSLERAAKDGTITLLDYEWSILPIERSKITVLTPYGIKEYESKE